MSRHVIPLRPQLLRATIGVQGNHSRPPSSTTCANGRSAQAARSLEDVSMRRCWHRNRGPNTPPARGWLSLRPSATPPRRHRGLPARGEPRLRVQIARVAAPTRGRLAALRAPPGRPVAARALRQVQAQTGGLQIFDSRTERAPGAGGRGIRRAHASLCGWWARRGARSGHGRAFKEFAAAAGCPAGRLWSERRARGRGAAQGSAQSNYSHWGGETGGKTGSGRRRGGTARRARGSSDADADAARPRRHAPVSAKVG